jgi:Ca-activated chloride channel homolog
MKFAFPAFMLFVFALPPASFAQNRSIRARNSSLTLTPDSQTFRLRVQEVNLVLTVADGKGHFVENLSPSDLKILDNNKQQDSLTFFQSETDLPLDVALVVDMSASIAYRFQAEQGTLNAFITRVARPVDSVMLFAFNDEMRLAAPVHGNWKEVAAQVKRLKPNGETALYDAVRAASQWLADEPRPARRVMIVVSDGEENHSTSTLDEAIGEALKAEATIYSVDVSDDHETDDGKQGEQILRRLSDDTGGRYIRAYADGDVGGAFHKIQRELRSQYALAYRPSNLAEQFFHRIQIIAPRNLQVRCRTGYYAKENF